jgi:hypothetical protein
MAYVTGIGSYGGTNQYKDRIFVGDDGTNVNPVAGHYYTSMMEHTPGNLSGVSNTRNSDGGIVAVVDSNRKIDEWNVDNLTLNGNELSSTDADGDIVFNPNGTGDVVLSADTVQVGDSGAAAKIVSNGAGALTVTTGGAADLVLNTNEGTNAGTVTLTDGSNGDITIAPDGTGRAKVTNATGTSSTQTITTDGKGIVFSMVFGY